MKKIELLIPTDIQNRFFAQFANKALTSINQKIDLFNAIELTECTRLEKISQLYEIYHAILALDECFSSWHVNAFTEYRLEIHKKMLDEITVEFRKLGVTSLEKNNLYRILRADAFLQHEQPDPSLLPHLISNMSYTKLSQFVTQLVDQAKFSSPYSPSERPDYEHFNTFLQTHAYEKIEYAQNCFIMKVTHLESQTTYLLKIEDRLGVPSFSEQKLRNTACVNYTAELFLEKKAFITSSNVAPDFQTVSVRVMEYIEGYDLSFRCSNHVTYMDAFIAALNDFKAVIYGIVEIQNQGFCMHDIKLPNMLKDITSNQIRFPDLKSLIYTANKKFVSRPDGDPFWFSRIIRSLETLSPEVRKALTQKTPCEIDIEPLHVYMVAMSLFHYLTGANYVSNGYFPPSSPGFFDDPIFNEYLIGKQYQEIITACTQERPEDRISLQELNEKLSIIELMINSTLEEILSAKLEILLQKYNEQVDKQYLEALQDKFSQSNTLEDKKEVVSRCQLYKDILSYLVQLKKNTQFKSSESTHLKQLVQRLKEGESIEWLCSDLKSIQKVYNKKVNLWIVLDAIGKKISDITDPYLKENLETDLNVDKSVYCARQPDKIKKLIYLAKEIDNRLDAYLSTEDEQQKESQQFDLIQALVWFSVEKEPNTLNLPSLPSPRPKELLFFESRQAEGTSDSWIELAEISTDESLSPLSGCD